MKVGFVLRSTIRACIRIKLSNKHLLIWKMLLCILKMIWVSVRLCLFEKLQGMVTFILAHCKRRSPLFCFTVRYVHLFILAHCEVWSPLFWITARSFTFILAHCKVWSSLFWLTARNGHLYIASLQGMVAFILAHCEVWSPLFWITARYGNLYFASLRGMVTFILSLCKVR